MAETRSAVPSQSPGTATGLGMGLPSIATTVNVCPGNARLRISVALPFRTLFRSGVAIHRHHRERVSGQRETADLGCAPVQDVEKHTFALLHAYRFTTA